MTDTTSRRRALLDALSRPDAYPGPAGDVQILQTPASVLFFAGERVYKLKKPVQLDFPGHRLDYRTPDDRRRYCEEEVRLNRRISPRMYLGVLPVTREADGRTVIGGKGDAVEWVVEMVRLPADGMLDVLLDRGAVDRHQLERVAAVLARFHERARTGPSVNQDALAPIVAERLLRNLEELGRACARSPEVLPRATLKFLHGRMRRVATDLRSLLERRVAGWHIREGHGDLRAQNVCLAGGDLDDVFVFDCVEFDRRQRCGDVARDLALLAMDLDHRGHVAAAGQLVRAYAEITSDPELEVLVPFYKTHWALVRARFELTMARVAEVDEQERRIAELEARRLVQLAVGYELPACLVLTSGLPSPGKALTAAYLASRSRALLLRDGGPANSSENGGRDRHRRMVEDAAERMGQGGSVIADGIFSRRSRRQPFLNAAARVGVRSYLLQLEVPDPVGPARAGRSPHARTDRARRTPEVVPEDRVLRRPAAEMPEEHCCALQERMIGPV